MSRKPVLSYDNLAITEEDTPLPLEHRQVKPALKHSVESELLRDVAHQTMMYLHVDGVRALDEYALSESTLHHKVKRHDLILMAIEEWAIKRGINAQFRAKERKFKARRRYVTIVN